MRGKSTPTTTIATATLNTTNSGGHTREKDQVLPTILSIGEELRNNNGATDKIIDEQRSNNQQLKANNDQLQKGMAGLGTVTKDLMEELTSIKTQLSEAPRQSASVTNAVSTLFDLATTMQHSPLPAASPGSSSPRTYASVPTNSINPLSSASQQQAPSRPIRSRNPIPGRDIGDTPSERQEQESLCGGDGGEISRCYPKNRGYLGHRSHWHPDSRPPREGSHAHRE